MDSSVGQLELALLQVSLHRLQHKFSQVIGPRYVELDEAYAQAARLRSRFVPAAHREALHALDTLRASAAECAAELLQLPADPDRLRHLHHRLARDFHPDLASDQARRLLREQLMTEANLAYHEKDIRRLELLSGSLDEDENGDAAQNLAALAGTPLNELRERTDYAARQKRDLLEELAHYIGNRTLDTRQKGAAMVFRPATGRSLVERALVDLAHVSSSRALRFPEGAGMGDLFFRAERDIDARLVALGKAQGTVRAQFGKSIILRIGSDCRDLTPLLQLNPDDLQGFIDEWPDFVILTDEQVLPLARFPSLEVLHLGRTAITGRVFDHFPPLHELRVLMLDETQFDDAGLLRLEGCIWMQRLDLSHTLVSGHGIRAIHNMNALRELSLYNTRIHDDDLEALHHIPGLRNLNLGLTGITDRAAQHLRGLHVLEVLNLGGTAITDVTLDVLATLPTLRELVLWETGVTEAGLDKLRGFPALRYLDVDQTKVTREALRRFHLACPEVRLPSDVWDSGD